MIKILLNSFKNLNDKIKKIMRIGLLIALIVSIIATIILSIYILFNPSTILYYIGLLIFKLSLIICIGFIICGYAVDIIQNGY